MQMVALNNGSVEPQPAVIATFMSLSGLWKGGISGMCAVIDLVDRCKNPQHRIDQESERTLKSLALLEHDGRIHETVRNIALSAAKGDGPDMVLISPIKPSDDDLELKQKVTETVDGNIGVQMAMMQIVATLSREQIGAFCDSTRNGSDLWDDYKAARTTSGSDDFGFSDYVRQVLSTTSHPMT